MEPVAEKAHPFDLIPCEGFGVTADRMYRPPPKMTRECAMQILAAVQRYGKNVMRPELLAQAKEAMK